MSDAADVEVRAREMGWRPQEEFKGDPERWVDAETFVKRGEEVLPLVKAENRRLHEQTSTLQAEIKSLKAAVEEQRKSMSDLVEFTQAQLAEKLAEQKRDLTAKLRAAKREDDDRAIEEIEEQLEENAEARAKLKEKPAAAPPPAAPQRIEETAEYRAWIAKNPWFGGTSRADQAKTAAAERFGLEAAKAGKTHQAFFDHVDEAMAEVYPPARRTDPTEDGRPNAGGGSGGKGDAGFNSLPAEAKAKAREQAPRFVGPNKMFKTEGDWFKYYAKQYNTEAA